MWGPSETDLRLHILVKSYKHAFKYQTSKFYQMASDGSIKAGRCWPMKYNS